MQTTAHSEVQTADVCTHLQSRGKFIINVAPTLMARGILSIFPRKRWKKTKKKKVNFSETKGNGFIFTRSLIECRGAAVAAQWFAIKSRCQWDKFTTLWPRITCFNVSRMLTTQAQRRNTKLHSNGHPPCRTEPIFVLITVIILQLDWNMMRPFGLSAK